MSRQNQRYAARLRKLDAYIGQLPDSQYSHDVFIDTDNPASCNTIGCAIGHAVASRKFNGLGIRYNGPGLGVTETYTFQPVADFVPADHPYPREGFMAWADHYFGPGSFARVFDTDPYYDNWFASAEVKRGGVIKERVRENIRTLAAEFETA